MLQGRAQARGLGRLSQGLPRPVLIVGGVVVLLALLVGMRRTGVLPIAKAQGTVLTATVTKGNVGATVNATGTLVTATAVPLSFKTGGKLAGVDVEVGQHVTANQVLARLDDTDAKTALSQAKAQLDQANANLAKVQAGPRPETIAVAKSGVDSAIAALQTAQGQQHTVGDQGAKDTAAAAVAVQAAAAAIGQAQQGLDSARQQQQATVAADQTNIQNAQGAVNNAAANLASVKNQVNAALANDNANVQAATVALDNAKKNLAAAQTAVQAALAADKQAVANAQTALTNAQAVANAAGAVQSQGIAVAQNNLYAAQVQRDSACGRTDGGPCKTGDANVNTAQTGVDQATAQVGLSQAQTAQTVANAESALKTAQQALDADTAKQQSNTVSLQASVDQATAAQLQAQKVLELDTAKQQGGVVTAQAQVDQANAALAAARKAASVDAAHVQAGVTQAEAALSQAQQALDQAKAAQQQTIARSDGAISSANSAVEQAKAAVQAAQATLKQASAPPTASDIDAAKAAVASAQANVDQAQNNLDALTLRAPDDGVISTVNAAVGQFVSGGAASGAAGAGAASAAAAAGSSAPSGGVMSIITGSLLDTAQVNEADMTDIRVGNPISFTVPAYTGRTFTGKVINIQPAGQSANNIVSFSVTSSVDATDAQLLPGMTATTTITTKLVKDVLAVPTAALGFAREVASNPSVLRNVKVDSPIPPIGAGQGLVLLSQHGKVHPVVVKLGISDGQLTSIDGNVQEGDAVVTGVNDKPSSRLRLFSVNNNASNQ